MCGTCRPGRTALCVSGFCYRRQRRACGERRFNSNGRGRWRVCASRASSSNEDPRYNQQAMAVMEDGFVCSDWLSFSVSATCSLISSCCGYRVNSCWRCSVFSALIGTIGGVAPLCYKSATVATAPNSKGDASVKDNRWKVNNCLLPPADRHLQRKFNSTDFRDGFQLPAVITVTHYERLPSALVAITTA